MDLHSVYVRRLALTVLNANRDCNAAAAALLAEQSPDPAVAEEARCTLVNLAAGGVPEAAAAIIRLTGGLPDAEELSLTAATDEAKGLEPADPNGWQVNHEGRGAEDEDGGVSSQESEVSDAPEASGNSDL